MAITFVIGQIVLWGLSIFQMLLIARMIISWIPLLAPRWRVPSLVAALFEIVYTLTDPPLKALAKVIPPLRIGAVSLDLGFMVLFFAIVFLQRIALGIFF